MNTEDLPICPLCDELYPPRDYKSNVLDICPKCEIHVDANYERVQDVKENNLTDLPVKDY